MTSHNYINSLRQWCDFPAIVQRVASVAPETPLQQCEPVGTSARWPFPIAERLNQLLDLARKAGEKLSKEDLLGALVLNARPDGDALGVLVRTYRRTPAGQAYIPPRQNRIDPPKKRRPGPRPVTATRAPTAATARKTRK